MTVSARIFFRGPVFGGRLKNTRTLRTTSWSRRCQARERRMARAIYLALEARAHVAASNATRFNYAS